MEKLVKITTFTRITGIPHSFEPCSKQVTITCKSCNTCNFNPFLIISPTKTLTLMTIATFFAKLSFFVQARQGNVLRCSCQVNEPVGGMLL